MSTAKGTPLHLSNSIEHLLFPAPKYTVPQLLNTAHYFPLNTKFSLQNYQRIMKQAFDIDEDRLWWVIKASAGDVDGKTLLIVLMLQLVGKERREASSFNEGAKNSLNSPRARTQRTFSINQEENVLLQFIKDHLATFLKLLSAEPNTADPALDVDEIEPLGLFFKVDKRRRFASNIPLFGTAPKVRVSALAEYLSGRIALSEQSRPADIDVLSLEGLSYVVTVKDAQHCAGKDVRIISCDASEIFINGPAKSVYLVDCRKSTIYIASCESVVYVDKCDKIAVTVATGAIRVCNTHESSLFYYGPSPILVSGSVIELAIGPNNSNAPDLVEHLKSANLEYSPAHLLNFTKVLAQSPSQYSVMKPDEYDLLVLPEGLDIPKRKKTDPQTILAPREFMLELEQRNAYFVSLMTRFGQSNLPKETEKHVHSAIQGNFKEWLINKSYVKDLKELVRMLERNEAK